jgi:hypothetical protein
MPLMMSRMAVSRPPGVSIFSTTRLDVLSTARLRPCATYAADAGVIGPSTVSTVTGAGLAAASSGNSSRANSSGIGGVPRGREMQQAFRPRAGTAAMRSAAVAVNASQRPLCTQFRA